MEIYFDENGKEHKKPKDVNPIWRISGYALIKEGEKLLMVTPMNRPKWELPGGGIEVSESISQGIKRECWEETGYKVEIEDQPAYFGERDFYSSIQDKFYRAIILVFIGRVADPVQHKEVINSVEPNEIGSVEWVDYKKLKENEVHPSIWPAIKREIESP